MPDYIYYNGELYHASKKKKPKYIAKVPIGKGKYRYFYTKEEYEAYKNSKKSKESESKTKPNRISKFFNKIKNIYNKVSKKLVSEVKATEKTVSHISKCLEKYGKEKISNVIVEKKHKYLYKEKIGFGKYRYFYDEKSHKIWLEKQKYINNEPDFMKGIPKTKDLTDSDAPVLTSADNSEAANKGWWSDDYKTNNCFFCTTAYELRQRGYDVVAKQTECGTLGEEAYDIFKDPKIVAFTKDVENNPDELRKQIAEQSGPGSRGNICVQLKPYGGHSMAYEVSPDGKEVVIVDAQTNENFSLAYVAERINTKSKGTKENSSMFFRTDNLELKEGVLNLVQPANTNPQVVVGEEDSISDRKTKSVIGLVSKTMEDYKKYFDENGNPTQQSERVYPEGYDEAKIKVTWR